MKKWVIKNISRNRRILFIVWEFFTHLATSPLPRTAANFDLNSELMAIEQWRFFSVPHILWHGAFVYNGHLRGPVTLTPICRVYVAAGNRTPVPNLPFAKYTSLMICIRHSLIMLVFSQNLKKMWFVFYL